MFTATDVVIERRSIDPVGQASHQLLGNNFR
jgi:hypothetical protein